MAQYDEAELMLDVLDRIGDHGFPNWASEAAALIRTQAARIAELEGLVAAEFDMLDSTWKARAEAEARAYARAAAIGYMICAKTRHVSLGNEVEAAIRALAQKEAGE